MKNLLSKIGLLCTSLLLSIGLNGQDLLKWDFAEYGGSTSVAAYFSETGIDISNAQLGPGFLPRNYLGNGLTASRQNQTTLADAINDGDYISFTVAPQSGKKLTVTSISLRPVAESMPRNFTLLSAIAGFNANSEIGTVYAGKNLGEILYDIPVTGHEAITEPVEFRIYIYGTFGNIYQGVGLGNGDGDDLIVTGTVQDDTGGGTGTINQFKEVQLGLNGQAYYSRPLYANSLYHENRGWRYQTDKNGDGTTEFVSVQHGLETYKIDGIEYIDTVTDQLNINGYPKFLNPGQVLLAQPGQNAGDHQYAYGGKICVTWEGEADIRVNGTFLSGPIAETGSFVNGKRYYDMGNKPNGHTIKIYAVNPNNPISKIRVWMSDPTDKFGKSLDPDEQNSEEYLFHPSYISLFADETFSIFRFMDLGATNHNDIKNWIDRRRTDECFQTGTGVNSNLDNVGIAYEHMIEICNRYNKDMWICVPAMATPDYIHKLAQLIDGDDPDGTGQPGLNENLHCYVEYANEIGWTYWRSYAEDMSFAEFGYYAGRKWVGRQAARTHSEFRSIVGESNPKYTYIHAIQTSAYGLSNEELMESVVNYGPTLTPSGVPDMMGVTSYFGSHIEEYVFNEINYWDPSVKEQELQKVFLEFEKRTLSGSASVTGVDFTGGGGVSSAAQDLSKQYGLPMIAYEGGCGLNTYRQTTACAKDCKLVDKNSEGSTCNIFLSGLAEACGGGDNYLNFIRAIHSDSLMRRMYYLNSSLAKAAGCNTITQFGEVNDVNKEIRWGYWGCINSYEQNPSTAHRYQFWLDWYAEQKNIREINDSVGTRPAFTSSGELYPARVGASYNQEINFDGGDGNLQLTLLSREDLLPQNISVSYQNNKIIFSGTPQEGDEGTYYAFYRLLDADNDPAYAIFTLRILPGPKDTVFAYDDFGTEATRLVGLNTGYGWSEPWYVQNNDTNWLVYNNNPFSHDALDYSGNGYANIGYAYKAAGRLIDVNAFDYLVAVNNSEFLGQTNTTLWMSMLVRRESASGKDIFFLMDKQYPQSNSDRLIKVSVLSNGNWGLYVRKSDNTFDEVDSGIPAANDGSEELIVLAVNFDQNSDNVALYINPAQLGGAAPATADAEYTTSDIELMIKRIGVYGESSGNKVFIDDIRLGDTYAAVTPLAIPHDLPTGEILCEYWTGITGTQIANLTSNANYPDNASGSHLLNNLQAVDWNNPSDYDTWADNYGQRIRGYIHPQTSGDYIFWIAGDDHCELWLSSDSNPSNASLAANIAGWTRWNEWNKYASQKSASMPLIAGKKYYIEVLHKENGGGDRVAVGWLKPGETGTVPSGIIPGTVLSAWDNNKKGQSAAVESVDMANQSEIKVYPTKIEHRLTIENAADHYLTIFNTSGLIVEKQLINQTSYSLDVSNLNKGIYFVTVQNGTKNSVFKVVK